MHWFLGILGALLALVWLDRLRDASAGLRSIPQIDGPEWDGRPEPAPPVSIIVAARNEEAHVEEIGRASCRERV